MTRQLLGRSAYLVEAYLCVVLILELRYLGTANQNC